MQCFSPPIVLAKHWNGIRSYFFHLLNLAMLNAHIIHIVKSRKKCKLEKKIVVKGIRQPLSEHTVERPAPGRHSTSHDPTRLTGRHFKRTLDVPLESKKKWLQRACYACKKQHASSIGGETRPITAENVIMLSAWSPVLKNITRWYGSKNHQY